MTILCLEEMLLSSLFRPRMATLTLLPQHEIDGRKIGRVGLVAEAVAPDADIGLPATLVDEYMQPYRSRGADLDHYRRR